MYGNMGIKRTVSIRRIDYWKGKVFTGIILIKKKQKTKIGIFPFVFLIKFLWKKESQIDSWRTSSIWKLKLSECSVPYISLLPVLINPISEKIDTAYCSNLMCFIAVGMFVHGDLSWHFVHGMATVIRLHKSMLNLFILSQPSFSPNPNLN